MHKHEGFKMLQRRLIVLSMISMFTTCCSTNTGIGVLSGSGVGAGAAGLIWGGGGALIGAAAGALTGGLIGASLDEQDRKVVNQSSPRTLDRMDRGEPLTLNDVIRLSQVGVSDETIIKYLDESGSIYNLTQMQIRRLQDAGVSERIIQYMTEPEMTKSRH
jgi:uncharacterized protein YcfJ